jgi:hypothetical protein
MEPQPLDHTFTATIQGDMGPHKWDMVAMPGSVEFFGTGKAVKVVATIDGEEVTTSLLPGGGSHLLPIKGAIGTAIGKSAGDEVTVHLTERLS